MSREKYPPCPRRKLVDGINMCMAIGCCVIGDMPCECSICTDRKGARCTRKVTKKGAKK